MKKKDISHLNLSRQKIMYKIIITFVFFITIPFQVLADQNDKRLNYLFDKLVIEEDEQAINKITNQILSLIHI